VWTVLSLSLLISRLLNTLSVPIPSEYATIFLAPSSFLLATWTISFNLQFVLTQILSVAALSALFPAVKEGPRYFTVALSVISFGEEG